MPDRTIPFSNIIMRCDAYTRRDITLPAGYSLTAYHPGFERAWAEMEYAIGDFASADEAERYFNAHYLSKQATGQNLLFAVTDGGDVVGSCIAWQDMRGDLPVASLHWLVVEEGHRGIGLGRALCTAVMNLFLERGEMPVYIHTQPWSTEAILLYVSLGFKMQKIDTFSGYTNQYTQSMETLERILTPEMFRSVIETAEV